MKYRKRLGKKASRKRFARSAKRVKKLNLGRPLTRGGYRL